MRYETKRTKVKNKIKSIGSMAVGAFLLWAIVSIGIIPSAVYNESPYENLVRDLFGNGNKGRGKIFLIILGIFTGIVIMIFIYYLAMYILKTIWVNSHLDISPLILEDNKIKITEFNKDEEIIPLDEIKEFMCKGNTVKIKKIYNDDTVNVENVEDASNVVVQLTKYLSEYKASLNDPNEQQNQ